MEKTNLKRVDAIYDKLDIVKVAESLGLKLKKRGNNYIVEECPLCGSKMVMYISPDKGIYKCFRCSESGTMVSLTMAVKKCSYNEALDYLEGLM